MKCTEKRNTTFFTANKIIIIYSYLLTNSSPKRTQNNPFVFTDSLLEDNTLSTTYIISE